jgi:hypothetical protein
MTSLLTTYTIISFCFTLLSFWNVWLQSDGQLPQALFLILSSKTYLLVLIINLSLFNQNYNEIQIYYSFSEQIVLDPR